jgi:peptide-methionine (S)-S-oxide reductase
MNSTERAGVERRDAPGELETAVVGGGCFWCLEAVFKRVEGVSSVVSGYAGGTVENPSYDEVCTGNTGHAEVVKVFFDSRKVGYGELLDIFWKAHDPTTLNRQGADVGTQYRSIILFDGEAQRKTAEASLAGAKRSFSRPIVTQVEPLKAFYKAEGYHENYYDGHKGAVYCRLVIAPKLKKLGMEA